MPMTPTPLPPERIAEIAAGRYSLVPITTREALRFCERNHRHLPDLQGALFAAGVERAGQLVGVATAGHPARVWMGTGRILISRCAAVPGLPGIIDSAGDEHAAPVSTMLYAALCRASKALGWHEAWTYTLPGEDGRSIRAAGFTYMGTTAGGDWDRDGRPRETVDPASKGRWARGLTPYGCARLVSQSEDERLAA